jgi:hypothetical protein
VGVLALAVTRPSAAQAQGAPTSAEPDVATASAIELAVVASESDYQRVRRLVGTAGSFGEIRWRRVQRFEAAELLEETPPSSEIAVQGWLDLGEPRHARLYFVDRAARRFLVRELDLPHRLDELGGEALAQVIQLSVSALMEDEDAGLSREQTESLLSLQGSMPARSTPQPKPARSERSHGLSPLGVSLFYEGSAYSAQIPWRHGPGLALSFRAELASLRLAVWISAQRRLTESYREPRIGAKLGSTMLRSGVTLLGSVGSGWLLGGRLGLGVDRTELIPLRGTDEAVAELQAARSFSLWSFAPALVSSVSLGARVSLSASLFLDVALRDVHYELGVAERVEGIVQPFRLQPGASFSIDLH